MSALNPELKQQLDATIAKYLADRYSFEERQKLVASEAGYSRDNWQQFADLGWLSISFEEEFGGAGGAVTDTVEMMRLFGRSLVVEPVLSTLGLVGPAIASGSNQSLKDSLIPRLIAGDLICALAQEEPGSRGNPTCVGVKATAEGEGYRLCGEKVAVLNAPQADYLLISARTAGDLLDQAGISLFLVEREQAGVTLQSYPMVDGHRAANITLDVWAGADMLLTAVGEGYSLLNKAVDNGLLMLSAEAVGIMQALLDTTIEYANTRKQFGVPLSSFQVLRHRMVDMFIELQRTSALLEAVVEHINDGRGAIGQQLHLLKAQVGRSGRVIGDSAIQLHGGMGMTDELIVGHYMKRLVAINQLLGNPDFHLKQVWPGS